MWNEALENLIVVKRSGQRVEFNASKIAIAIKKSFESVDQEIDEKKIYKLFEKVLTYMNETYADRKTINVEDIQDIIEDTLKKEKYIDVYNSFKEYRNKRAASRKVFTEKQQHKFVKAIEKVEEESNLQNENYRTPYSVLTKFGRIISEEYTKSYILDNKYVREHEEGHIFIHDLSNFNLGLIPHINLKMQIKSYDLYLDNFINELINLQNEVNYEIELNDFDLKLEEYFLGKYNYILNRNLSKYFKLMGYLEITNIKKYEEIINKYHEIDLINENLLDNAPNKVIKNVLVNAIEDSKEELDNNISKMIERVIDSLSINVHKNNIFNISLSTSKKYIPIIIRETIVKYLNTNYLENIHFIFKVETPTEDILSLIINHKNISLLLKDTTNRYLSNGLKLYNNNPLEDNNEGKMILACTSINLARLGLKYRNKDISLFYKELDETLEIAKNELITTFETIGNKTKENYQILFNGNIKGDEKLEPNQKIRKVIKQGILNLGLIGIKECITSLKDTEEESYKLLLELLKYLNDKLNKYKEETKLNFALYEPSDEKSRKSLIAIDKSIYGINKGITDKITYDLIQNFKYLQQDLSRLEKVFNLFTGGMQIKYTLPSNTSSKKILELINKLKEINLEYVRIEVSKK